MALFGRKRVGTESRVQAPQGQEPRQAAPQDRGVGGAVSDRDILAGIADQAQRGQAQRQGIVASQRVRDLGENTRNLRETPNDGVQGVQGTQGTLDAGNTAAGNVRRPGGQASLPEKDASGSKTQGSNAEAAKDKGSGEGGRNAHGKAPRRPSAIARLAGGIRRLAFFAVFLCVLVSTLFAVYRFSLWLYGWMHTSPMFVTRHIDITGNVRLQRDVILHLGGLKEGDNVFEVSVAAVERRLRTTPWVEDVSVKRVLPDQFVIRLHERMPSFWVRKDGRLFYSNDRGEIIAPVESDNFMSLPILSIEAGCEDAIPYLSRLMRDIRDGQLPVEAGAVATVDVTAARGVEMYLEDRELRLSLAPDDWNGNLLRLGATIGDLARRRELSQAREVRASRDSVWVVLRQPAEQERP